MAVGTQNQESLFAIGLKVYLATEQMLFAIRVFNKRRKYYEKIQIAVRFIRTYTSHLTKGGTRPDTYYVGMEQTLHRA